MGSAKGYKLTIDAIVSCYVADVNMPHAFSENELYRSILGIMGLTKSSQGTDRPNRDQLRQSQEQDPKAS